MRKKWLYQAIRLQYRLKFNSIPENNRTKLPEWEEALKEVVQVSLAVSNKKCE